MPPPPPCLLGCAARIMTGAPSAGGRGLRSDAGADRRRRRSRCSIYAQLEAQRRMWCSGAGISPPVPPLPPPELPLTPAHIWVCWPVRAIPDAEVFRPLTVGVLATGSELLEAGEAVGSRQDLRCQRDPERRPAAAAGLCRAAAATARMTRRSSPASCGSCLTRLRCGHHQRRRFGRAEGLPARRAGTCWGHSLLFAGRGPEARQPHAGGRGRRQAGVLPVRQPLCRSGNSGAVCHPGPAAGGRAPGGGAAFFPRTTWALSPPAFPNPARVTRFLRARAAGRPAWTIPGEGNAEAHSSGSLSAMMGCNCLVELPAGSGPVAPGEEVEVLYFVQ